MGSSELRQGFKGTLWIAVYLCLILAPLFVLLLGPTPAGRGFWIDFSLALGFSAAAMMAMQFLLTARLVRATAPFGIDIIYYFHRFIAVVALLFALAHPVILAATNRSFAVAMNPLLGSWPMIAGETSVFALLILSVTSFWRKQLRIRYGGWRRGHVLLSGLALALALGHIYGFAYYTAAFWKLLLWTLILVSWLGVVLYVRLVKPWRLLRRPWRTVAVEPERGDTWTLVLEADGHAGIPFSAGQFVWLWLATSPFTMKEHPFSIASSPSTPMTVKLTIKERGNFTQTVGRTPAGTRAYLEGPHGAFTIDRYPAPGAVFVAGGIGIAPIMSMLRSLADRGDSRHFVLIYGNRRWERVVFREELEELNALARSAGRSCSGRAA